VRLRPINCLQSLSKYRGLASSFVSGFNLNIDPIMTPFVVKNSRRLFFVLLVAPLGTMAQPPPDLAPLPEDLIPSLRQVLTAALVQSPQMVQSNISIATAEAVRIQNRAAMLPNLSGSANYSRNQTSVAGASGVSSVASGFFYNLGVSQPIFQWGALKNRTESATIGIKIAEHQYADAYRMLVVNLRAQFLALVAKKIALRNTEFTLKQAEDSLALAEANLKAGRISPEAMMEPRLAVDQARLDRDQTREDLENSQRLFLLTAGLTDLSPDAIPDEIPRPAYAPEVAARLLRKFTQAGADDTFAAATYRGYIEQADLDYRIARVNLLPKFSFGAGYGQQNMTSAGPNYVSQVTTITNYWNINAYWSIFDGFATRGAKLAALARKRSYERTLRSVNDQAIAQAQDMDKQLGFAWRALQIWQTRHDVGGNALQRAQDDLKLGKTSQTAVNAAQMTLYQTDYTLAAARGTFLNDWSQFVSTLCVDPMLNQIPPTYLRNAK
jgi:outer membrane protein TolC